MAEFVFDTVRCNQMVSVPGWCVWCGSMVRTPDGKCHLFLSMWEQKWEFETGWSTHSNIGYAVSDEPDGKYEFKGIILKGSGIENGFDRDSVHNPFAIRHDGNFYVYYSANYGDGIMKTHTKNQKIGVAYAKDPLGEWTRFDTPIFKKPSGEPEDVLTTNPSICQMADGRFIMIYKMVRKSDNKVIISAAFSESPLGPWRISDTPIFDIPGAHFAAEDPCVYRIKNKLYCLLHDMKNYYVPDKFRTIIQFESENGIDWKPADPLFVCSRTVDFEGEGKKLIYRLERPFMYIENDEPKVFFAAILPRVSVPFSCNIHTKVKLKE